MAMASRSHSVFSFFLALIFFASLASACGVCGPKPTPKLPTPEPPAPKPRQQSPPAPTLPSPQPVCPIDALGLKACVDVLGGLVSVIKGTPPTSKCCTLLQGLADVEAALCLCTAIKANVHGINLNVPVALSLLINKCNKKIPDGYKCA